MDDTPPQVSYCEQETIEPTVEENRNQETIYNKTLEKGKEKEHPNEELEETVFATDGLRVLVINSPTHIYKHFPRRVTFVDELRERLNETEISSSEEIGSRGNTSDSDDQFSDDNTARLSPITKKTSTSDHGKTAKKCLVKK